MKTKFKKNALDKFIDNRILELMANGMSPSEWVVFAPEQLYKKIPTLIKHFMGDGTLNELTLAVENKEDIVFKKSGVKFIIKCDTNPQW